MAGRPSPEHRLRRHGYTRMVPNSASAMPTLPRMKYFHAASSAARRPVETDHQHRDQRRQLDAATHSRPILLASSARFMANSSAWIHGVIEAQIQRRQPPGFHLVGDVAGAEQRWW
jgi:hypothetical protein